jgi:hypothetical protein
MLGNCKLASPARMACVAALLIANVARGGDDPQTAARKARINYVGGGATKATVDSLGVTELMGKALPTPSVGDGGKSTVPAAGAPISSAATAPLSNAACVTPGTPECAVTVSDAEDRSAHNVAIQNFDQSSENEPMVAANPRNPRNVVSGFHFYGDQNILCAAHYSRDGGKNWSPRAINMPLLTKSSSCSDSVLAYAPDGSRVYFAYIDLKFSSFDIVVSYSDDDGKTWTGPIVALTAGFAADFDKPWIGTHVATSGGGGDDGDDDGDRQANRKFVYVTATRFDNTPPFACHIQLTRSSDKGMHWSAPTTLDSSVGGCGSSNGPNASFPVVQGSRPAGGINNDVVATWYNSGPDGFLNGHFNIRTRYSADNGATFGPISVASDETTMFELPFWLGPFARYHRWWGAMFPSIAITPGGSAHIGYAAAPVPSPGTFALTPANGEIRYVTSGGPPYGAWTAPMTVNDDAPAAHGHGWATIGATSRKGTPTVYLMWEDHRVSLPGDNLTYDVFWSKKVGTGSWSSNEKLTDVTSMSDFIFLGDYFGMTVVKNGSSDPFVYGVWTDRRDEPSPFFLDDDIWGARIPGKNMDDD